MPKRDLGSAEPLHDRSKGLVIQAQRRLKEVALDFGSVANITHSPILA